MSESSAYQSYAHEKALARLKRAAHGEDQTRDRAELRHQAIDRWVLNMRFWGPMLVAILFGWVGNLEGWPVSVLGVIAALLFAKILSNIAKFVVGPFNLNLERQVNNLTLHIVGAFMVFLGLSFGGAPGLVVTGLVQATTPIWWSYWARHVLGRTDFAKMKRTPQTPAAPRIIE